MPGSSGPSLAKRPHLESGNEAYPSDSVNTLSDNSKPQLASSVRSHKLWCQARALLAPVSLATKMSASRLIHFFSSHPSAFGFRSSILWITSP